MRSELAKDTTVQVEKSEKIYLVSACLVGLACRYNGKHEEDKVVRSILQEAKLIPVCPEQVGGLPTPRSPAEIVNGSGEDVLENQARVVNVKGEDVTEFFIKGAFQVLKMARMTGCRGAILKEKSPSCGLRKIYDGSFNGVLRKGKGVTTALLSKEGIEVVSENDIRKAYIRD